MEQIEQMRANWRSFLPTEYQPPKPDDRLVLPEEAWRTRLDPAAYAVLREEATEIAFSSPLSEETRRGLYVCRGCDLPLFTSEMKYDSGTGWPSFFTTIPDAVETRVDSFLGFEETEYHCARCGGHHGHVFDDGPPPTRQRWCNNGVALRFFPGGS